MTASRPLATLTLALMLFASSAGAQNLRIPLPKKSKETPVQKLNRDGVREVVRRNYEKARMLFFRAYLLDPNDPFTLNNLGYIAEMQGDADAAQRYYALAAQFRSDAVVDRSNIKSLVGKPVDQIAGRTEDKNITLNRMNVRAMALLQQDRAPEADLLLNQALKLDPRNPFTLNNLGFAKEKEGELENAYAYYYRAATAGSDEKVIVAAARDWRGKPISEVAAANAREVRRLLAQEDTPESKVARLNLMGVSAINRNDRRAARTYFEQANKISPTDAFTLNNMGYVSELDGDRETAEFYYAKARAAERAEAPVGVATRLEAEGQPLREVALSNRNDIDATMQQMLEQRRRTSAGPVLLRDRSGRPVVEPEKPVPPLPQSEMMEPESGPAAQPSPETAPTQPGTPPEAQPAPSQPAPAGSNTPGGSFSTKPAPQQQSAPALQQPAVVPQQQPAAAPPPEPEHPGEVVVPYDAPVTPKGQQPNPNEPPR